MNSIKRRPTPDLVRKPRYSVTLTFEGGCFLVIAAFILAGALARQINLLMVLFGLLAGAFLMHWRMVKRMLRKIEVERHLPKSVSAGDLLVVEFLAVNGRRRLGAWAVDVIDTLRREGRSKPEPPVRPRALFSYIPAGEKRATTYRGRLCRRGRYRFGPLQLSSRFPLGFLQYRATIEAGDTLLVFPRLGQLTPTWRRWQEGIESGMGKSSSRQGLQAGDFYALRDWRSGDSRRWLHWRTSARRQTLVVRQFEQERDRGLAVVLDLWQPEKPDADQLDSVEIAVSLAATVAADLCRAGGRRLCVAVGGDDPCFIEGPASPGLLEEVLGRLATTEASPAEHLPNTLTGALDRLRRGTQVMVVSTRPVDIENDRRFDSLRSDSRREKWLSNLKTVDTSGSGFSELFQVA
jgi:uncharacterized protein (DUF58 family)